MVAKKVTWIKIPPKIFFACKHFGTGVLIATAFVHVSIGEVKQGNASISRTHISFLATTHGIRQSLGPLSSRSIH